MGPYLSLSGLDHKSAAMQVQALTLCFTRETVTNLGLSEDQRKDVKQIVSAIQRYVEGQVNESVERRNFRKRVQQPGETFDDFLVSLRAKPANFGMRNAHRGAYGTRSLRSYLMGTLWRTSSGRETYPLTLPFLSAEHRRQPGNNGLTLLVRWVVCMSVWLGGHQLGALSNGYVCRMWLPLPPWWMPELPGTGSRVS